jgi:hypothetical protein
LQAGKNKGIKKIFGRWVNFQFWLACLNHRVLPRSRMVELYPQSAYVFIMCCIIDCKQAQLQLFFI